jgi:hypothetical protein
MMSRKVSERHAALVRADSVNKTLQMSIAFGRISSQQFWEAIREQLQVWTVLQRVEGSHATVLLQPVECVATRI